MPGTFCHWLAQLDEAARELLGREIVRATGAECWRELFEDGLTPREAVLTTQALRRASHVERRHRSLKYHHAQ